MKGIAALGARKTWLWRQRGRFGAGNCGDPSRLLVDVSAIVQHDAKTGIQRVVRAVWSELSRRGRDNGFEVRPIFATKAHGYCFARVNFLDGAAAGAAGEPVSMRHGDKFVGLDLSAHLLPHYRAQLTAWRAQGASIHLVVYDLLPLERPEWFNAPAVSNFRKWYDVLAHDADQAICISEQVARELRHRIALSGRRGPAVVRMHLGADIEASIPSTGVSREASDLIGRLQSRRAVLMVGTIEPRKGHDVALAAFEHLWRTRPADAPNLVIVGKPGWKTADLIKRIREQPEQGARLHWLSAATDEALCRLYEGCAGVFVASHAEGFGLPLVEAAMFKRPVLARNLPVFREQGLANVSFFDDDSPEALAPRLIELARVAQSAPTAVANLATWSESVAGLLRVMGLPEREDHETVTQLRKAS